MLQVLTTLSGLLVYWNVCQKWFQTWDFKFEISAPFTFPFLEPGNPYWRGRLSTVDLLIKVACFVKKVNNIIYTWMSWAKLVSTRRSTVLILLFSKNSLVEPSSKNLNWWSCGENNKTNNNNNNINLSPQNCFNFQQLCSQTAFSSAFCVFSSSEEKAALERR